MNEVKISFNKQTWDKAGTYYRGCFTLTKDLFNEFKAFIMNSLAEVQNKSVLSSSEMNQIMYLSNLKLEKDEWSKHDCLFMTLTQRTKLVEFLTKKGINFNSKRAFNSFNYYIEIR